MYLSTQDKPFFPRDYGDKFSMVKDLGFDGFEVDGRELRDHYQAIEKASAKAALPVRMVCGGYTGWIGDFDEERRRTCLEEIRAILERCPSLGISGLVAPAAWGMFSLRLPPMVPPRDAGEDRRVLLDSLAVLNDAALKTGARIYLEPLNRYENHMILLVEEAVSLILAGNFSQVLVTADFFHMNIEEARIEETLDRFAAHIGHIHLASSQRLQPGAGHLDYEAPFRVLRKNGYQGGFCFECRVQAGDPAAAYRKSVELIRSRLSRAGY
ncbi:MAG: sugar phosphate isomerase/epimerase [Treponema sp.]|jgi:sugar phosphate isomerase/epimerase|nr:sugar phosphate isomerase/epimerase [Treponema sp.]